MQSLHLSGIELLAWRRKQLDHGGRQVDLDWLLDFGGGLRWTSLQKLILNPNRLVQLDQSLEELSQLWHQHLTDHTPLQYLVGRCPWRDFDLEACPDVFIPRQETELLVEFALERLESLQSSGRWADLGTGSGALAVALARALPAWDGHAVDCSSKALALAARNLKRLAPHSNCRLHLGSWWEPLKTWWGSFRLVLVNPPYIPQMIVEQLPPVVREHEPYLALCGGTDGLQACRDVIQQSINALEVGGWLMLEHHHDQSDSVLNLMEKQGLKELSFERDLHGIKRFAIGKR